MEVCREVVGWVAAVSKRTIQGTVLYMSYSKGNSNEFRFSVGTLPSFGYPSPAESYVVEVEDSGRVQGLRYSHDIVTGKRTYVSQTISKEGARQVRVSTTPRTSVRP